jgi:glycosyltransferase involved in cell wall biosynthesis
MRESDFLLMFSNYENLPCVIAEAFASGMPVLATDVGGIREMIRHERLGRLVQAKDEEALLKETRWMMNHARGMDGEYIARFAEENFGEEVIGKQIAALYERALGGSLD